MSKTRAIKASFMSNKVKNAGFLRVKGKLYK